MSGRVKRISVAAVKSLGLIHPESVELSRFGVVGDRRFGGVGAHEEDGWIGRDVQIGRAVIAPLGDVGRCVVTKCDPDIGTSDLDTLGALARYRREGVTEPLPFGVYGDVIVPGRVRIGIR